MTLQLTLARTCFVLLLVLSLVLFLLPVTPDGPEGSDKVGHLVIFAVLALVGRWSRLRAVPLLGGLATYAVLTELLQATMPLGRRGDPADVVADVLGVLLGLAVRAAAVRVAVRIRAARRAAPSPPRPRG